MVNAAEHPEPELEPEPEPEPQPEPERPRPGPPPIPAARQVTAAAGSTPAPRPSVREAVRARAAKRGGTPSPSKPRLTLEQRLTRELAVTRDAMEQCVQENKHHVRALEAAKLESAKQESAARLERARFDAQSQELVRQVEVTAVLRAELRAARAELQLHAECLEDQVPPPQTISVG